MVIFLCFISQLFFYVSLIKGNLELGVKRPVLAAFFFSFRDASCNYLATPGGCLACYLSRMPTHVCSFGDVLWWCVSDYRAPLEALCLHRPFNKFKAHPFSLDCILENTTSRPDLYLRYLFFTLCRLAYIVWLVPLDLVNLQNCLELLIGFSCLEICCFAFRPSVSP